MPDLPNVSGTCRHPPIPKSPGSNWVEKAGGLPREIECVARALYWGPTAHLDKSKAYRMAVGVVRNWAEGKGNVTAPTRARAAAAIARWEAMRAKAKAT